VKREAKSTYLYVRIIIIKIWHVQPNSWTLVVNQIY